LTGYSPLDNLDVKVFTERICDLRGNLQICGWRRDVRISQRNWDEYREAAEMVPCGAGGGNHLEHEVHAEGKVLGVDHGNLRNTVQHVRMNSQ